MYCFHFRVIVLSILPVTAMGAFALALGHFYWDDAVAAVRATLESYELFNAVVLWLKELGMGGLQRVMAPALLLFLVIPVMVVVTMLAIALFMTPAMVTLVASRRFPQLARKKGASRLASLGWSLGSTAMAAMALLASLPLWLVPPLILILPPLVWGWLTYRVMAFDALADHASAQERREILKQHQGVLLVMGVLSGYLGSVPSLLWVSGAMLATMAPILVPAAIWVTLVFVFSLLWFAHYCLAALEQLRKKSAAPAPPPASSSPLEPPAKISISQEAAPAPAPPAPPPSPPPPPAPMPAPETSVPPAGKPEALA